MRLGFLTFIPRDQPQRPLFGRLRTAFESHGHQWRTIHHGEIYPLIARREAPTAAASVVLPEIPDPSAATHNAPSFRLEESPFAGLDAVMVRYDGAWIGPSEFYLIQHLTTLLPVVNPPEAGWTLCNKFSVYLEMARQGLATPRTLLLRRHDHLDELVEQLGGFPVVIKRIRGARGRSVALAESNRSLRSMIDMIWSLDRREPLILQEFIPGIGELGGPEDLRLWVVGGRVIGAARRIPAPGDFRGNADLGARWEACESTHAERVVALRAAAALKAEYMGVDMIRLPKPEAALFAPAPLLLDLNSNAEFKEFDEATGLNVAAELVRLVEGRVEAQRGLHAAPRRFASPPQAIEWLYSLPRHQSLLAPERLRLALRALGQPHLAAPACVVVAGSNGKGTTCSMLERICREAGLRTGLFTSPHLLNFEERFRVDGRAISQAEVARLARQIEGLVRSEAASASWRAWCGFDAFVMMAALLFAGEGVDVAIYEAGIGGDRDATNALDCPLITIGQIDLEHTELLGYTREEILREKMGLMRPGGVVLLQHDHALTPVAMELANARGATLEAVPPAAALTPSARRHAGHLANPFEQANAAMARRAAELLRQRFNLDISHAAIAAGPEKARWPGRMTILEDGDPLILTDAAHTPGSMRILADFLADTFPGRPLVLVLATAAAKCTPEIAGPLCGLARHIVATQASYRAACASDVATLVHRVGHGHKLVATEARLDAAIARARAVAAPGSVLLIGGGLFAAADALRLFNISLEQL